eukprot:174265-Lingulodinium_polyedra.AAC.1
MIIHSDPDDELEDQEVRTGLAVLEAEGSARLPDQSNRGTYRAPRPFSRARTVPYDGGGRP